MFKKRYLAILLFLIIGICAISTANASDLNATDEIISEEAIDEISISEDEVLAAEDMGSYYDLDKRISSNYKNGKVNLYKDYAYDPDFDDDAGIYDSVTIDQDIEIYGHGHTIYANNAQPFYITEKAHVAIYDLTFVGEYRKGYTPPSFYGGAIDNAGTLYLENCVFHNCMAYNEGGAIYNNGLLVMEGCVFMNNYLYSETGLGGAISNDNLMIVNNTYFINNTAYKGGAINTAKYTFVQASVFGGYDDGKSQAIVGSNKADYGISIYNNPKSAADAYQCYFNETTKSGVEVISDVIASTCTFCKGNNVKGGILSNYTCESTISHPDTAICDGLSINATPSINTYYNSGNDLLVTVTNKDTGKGVANVGVALIIDGNDQNLKIIVTNSSGVAKYSASTMSPGDHKILLGIGNDALCAENITVPVTVKKTNLAIKVSKMTTTYKSGKKWTIKVTDESNGKPAANINVNLKVYTGSKYKTHTVKTNSEGIATFAASTLAKGNHKVILSISKTGYSAKSVTSNIKINAKKLYIVGETNKFKDCTQLILGAYDKEKDKLVSGIKLQIKIYTGKKYKTFNLVTKKSKTLGDILVLLETNAFSPGKHLVKVKVTTPNYTGSEKDYIVIAKTAKKYKKFTYVITNGKGKYV